MKKIHIFMVILSWILGTICMLLLPYTSPIEWYIHGSLRGDSSKFIFSFIFPIFTTLIYCVFFLYDKYGDERYKSKNTKLCYFGLGILIVFQVFLQLMDVISHVRL